MATLVYSDADGVDRSFALGSEPVMVGRAAECGIRSEDPRVSRIHARFFVDGGALWVEDLGSSNGIFVGPNKVQRAPVPTGEIILVGSLVIRLLPASGTMPPPMGLHGTLAAWLDLERKTRAAVEDERDAFAQRVGELHQLLAAQQTPLATVTLRDGSSSPFAGIDRQPNRPSTALAAEAIRLRDEADAKAAALESALAAMQDEMQVLRKAAAGASDDGADLVRLRDELAQARASLAAFELESSSRAEWSNLEVEKSTEKLKAALDDAESARSIAEHAAGEAVRDAQQLREQLDQMRRESHAEIEIVRLELAKSKEAKMIAETAAGVAVAEKLAESDLVVMTLQRDLAAAREAANAGPDPRIRELGELNAAVTGRVDKAEKDLAAAQIRAQGAERNLSGANQAAAKAETRAAMLEQKLADGDLRVKTADDELAKARERIVALETRIGAGDAPVQAAEARAAKLAADLAEMTNQFETRRDRLVELEAAVAAAQGQAREAESRVATANTEVTAAAAKLSEADQRVAAFQTRLDQLAKADSAIAAAAKAKAEATERAASADKRVLDAERRADDFAQRTSAADTMAKAMAKDVAEALRRAAEADMRARSVAREVDNAHRRADQAEAVSADVAATIGDAQRRVTEAEAEATRAREELDGRLKATQDELGSKLAATKLELGNKLDALGRELAAERSTITSMVDRKTQLERELADARAQLPAAVARAEAASQKAVEHEVQIETLQDRVLDLESGMAVSETAQQASLAEAREDIKTLKIALAEAKVAIAKAEKLAEERTRVAEELERQLREVENAKGSVEVALRGAQTEIDELRRASELRTGSQSELQERLEDALAHAGDADRKIDALTARAEAADLAIGRAGALQRQLDEAISKLAWIEREAQNKARETVRADQSEAIVADRIAAAESRAKEADARAQEAEARIEQAERRVQQTKQDLADQATTLERRSQDNSRSVAVELERRVRDAEGRVVEADNRAQTAERALGGVQHQLAEAQTRVAALEREVATADNVRSFAAETEREIAQFQRDLRDARSKLTQMTLERDRLAIEVRDSRSDSDTTSRRAPPVEPRGRKQPASPQYDPEVTASLDVARIEAIIARASELEQKLVQAERDTTKLRSQLSETEQRLRDAIDARDDDADATRTGSQLPIVLAEHVSILEESIDSLRANMRAASDETAIMEQSDSVIAVSSAVSQAAEHIERARAAVRALAHTIGMSS